MITICLVKPRRVFFLCSPKTEKLIESIRVHTGMDAHCLDRDFVEKDDALPIYQAVHAAFQKEENRLGRAPRVAIDMTGGTKLMGAGCAMAGVLLKADIYYVAGDFDPVSRRPIPGTERLVRFQDPYAEFGDLEADKARARFSRHDYGGAAQIFEEIAERVAKPRTYQCLGHLSRAYDAWDNVKIPCALEQLTKACSLASKFRTDSATMKALPLDILEFQSATLRKLDLAMSGTKLSLALLQDDDVFSALLFTVLENSRRREERESYEAASLLLYRAIEMMAQRRLALRGFDTSTSDYALLGIDPVEDVEAIRSKTKFPEVVSNPLPKKVSLFFAYILLAWLKDPYSSGKPPLDLGRLSHIISARNEGLYAHGFSPTDQRTHYNFRCFADDCLLKLCLAEEWDRDQMRKRYRFIDLPG